MSHDKTLCHAADAQIAALEAENARLRADSEMYEVEWLLRSIADGSVVCVPRKTLEIYATLLEHGHFDSMDRSTFLTEIKSLLSNTTEAGPKETAP